MKKLCNLIKDSEGKITYEEIESSSEYVRSFASTYDDVIVYNLLGGKKKGFYIDIGAFDPNSGSNTRLFYDLGWSGVNVEPNSEIFTDIAVYRPRDINLNYAVSYVPNAQVTFYKTNNEGWGYKSHEQSTILEDVALYRKRTSIREEYREVYNIKELDNKWHGHMEQLQQKGDNRFITESRVSTITLKQLCQIFDKSREIDYLSIDVEGAEHLVVQGGDFSSFRPKIIECEDNKPYIKREDLEKTFRKIGYRFLFQDSIYVNKYFVREESFAEINTSLEIPFMHPVDWFIREKSFDQVLYCKIDFPNHFYFSEKDFLQNMIIVGLNKERGDKIFFEDRKDISITSQERGDKIKCLSGSVFLYDFYEAKEIL